MTEVDPARSRTMHAVRSQDTGPEVTVRRIAHKLGYRFRLHRKDLPGTPDLVFPRFRKVIFVHGCFWHGHDCPRGSRVPKTNRDYWAGKLKRNKARDAKALSDLRSMGWLAQTLWECEIRNPEQIEQMILSFLVTESADPETERPVSHQALVSAPSTSPH